MFHSRCKHWISSKQRSRPTYTENRIMLLVYITKYLWPCYGVIRKSDTSGLSWIDVLCLLWTMRIERRTKLTASSDNICKLINSVSVCNVQLFV